MSKSKYMGSLVNHIIILCVTALALAHALIRPQPISPSTIVSLSFLFAPQKIIYQLYHFYGNQNLKFEWSAQMPNPMMQLLCF